MPKFVLNYDNMDEFTQKEGENGIVTSVAPGVAYVRPEGTPTADTEIEFFYNEPKYVPTPPEPDTDPIIPVIPDEPIVA